MKNAIQKLIQFIFTFFKNKRHYFVPLFIALFPILFLFSNNLAEVTLQELRTVLLAIVPIVIIISYLVNKLLKDRDKTLISMSLFWLLFFFYERIFQFADALSGPPLVGHRYLFPLSGLLLVLLCFQIFRFKKHVVVVAKFFIVFSVFVIGLQIFNLSTSTISSSASSGKDSYKYLVNNVDKKLLVDTSAKYPDIYYIILDSYPRSDSLKEYFKFDNQEFDDFLKSSGFYIASRSHSNYNQTNLSVPSIMNMSYIQDLHGKGHLTKATLINLYHKNKVLDYLRAGNYTFVNNSNVYYTKLNTFADINVHCEKSNQFQIELVNSTALKPFRVISNKAQETSYKDAQCTLQNINAEKVGLRGPQFVFTHLLPPHPPYLFDENGMDITGGGILSAKHSSMYREKDKYIAQLKYINKRMRQAVEGIMGRSKNSIIIIQSDHGTLSSADPGKGLSDRSRHTLNERSRNYLAVYLPNSCSQNQLYDSITGVNTFRVVFNSCFNAQYQLLDDKIWYSSGGYKDFKDITDMIRD